MDKNSKNITPQAKKLKVALEKNGLYVIPEYNDGYKTVDIFIPEAKIAIEVDGLQHVSYPKQIIADFKREHYSNLNNIDTLHLANIVVDEHLDKIANAIVEIVKERKLFKTLETFQAPQTINK
jgi:hypothetical protein